MREMYSFALYIGTCGLPDFKRLGIITKLNTNFLKYGVSVSLYYR